MNYRREIDGLRSIAVLPVIFFHAGITVFSGGYVGVDIFFVISGYLITSIIITEKASATFTIRNFYERRARRILPALFFVMIACIPFAWAWMLPAQLKEFSQSLAAVSLFSSNILFWSQSGYFAPAAELKPLLHTWSLAVEEQYYIFFPIFILATWRFGQKAIFSLLLLIGTTSLLLAQWGSANYPSANFYLLPTRLWELLIGSLIALYLLQKGPDKSASVGPTPPTDQLFSGIGMALILYAIFAFNEATPFPGFTALVPTIGTALVILFASNKTAVAILLSHKFPVGIGLISYSAYLWHQPLFAFARIRSIHEPSQALMLLLGLLSLVLAFATWKYVEKPFRNPSTFSRSQIFCGAGIASVVVIGVGFAGFANHGFPARTSATGDTFASLGLTDRIRPNYGLSEACGEAFTLSQDCRTNDQPDILVWGDSYAMQLVPGILSSNPNAKIIQMTKNACGPIIGLAPERARIHGQAWSAECLAFNAAVARWIKDNNGLRYAVLSSPFKRYLATGSALTATDGTVVSDASGVYGYFARTLEFLISRGIQPIVFAPPPAPGDAQDIGACVVKASVFGDDPGQCNFSRSGYRDKNRAVVTFLGQLEQQYRVIWLEDFLCAGETCRTAIDGALIYRDAGHLSYEGSRLVGARMDFYSLITSAE